MIGFLFVLRLNGLHESKWIDYVQPRKSLPKFFGNYGVVNCKRKQIKIPGYEKIGVRGRGQIDMRLVLDGSRVVKNMRHLSH